MSKPTAVDKVIDIISESEQEQQELLRNLSYKVGYDNGYQQALTDMEPVVKEADRFRLMKAAFAPEPEICQ
jgi:hypothetical protein